MRLISKFFRWVISLPFLIVSVPVIVVFGIILAIGLVILHFDFVSKFMKNMFIGFFNGEKTEENG